MVFNFPFFSVGRRIDKISANDIYVAKLRWKDATRIFYFFFLFSFGGETVLKIQYVVDQSRVIEIVWFWSKLHPLSKYRSRNIKLLVIKFLGS